MFDGEERLFKANVQHDPEKLKSFARVSEQKPYRVETILAELEKNQIDIAEMDAFAAYSGGLVSTPGGIFPVNDKILEDCSSGRLMEHPAFLGAQIIGAFAEQTGKPAYLVNPPEVDECDDVARLCGIKGIHREIARACAEPGKVAMRAAAELGKKYVVQLCCCSCRRRSFHHGPETGAYRGRQRRAERRRSGCTEPQRLCAASSNHQDVLLREVYGSRNEGESLQDRRPDLWSVRMIC